MKPTTTVFVTVALWQLPWRPIPGAVHRWDRLLLRPMSWLVACAGSGTASCGRRFHRMECARPPHSATTLTGPAEQIEHLGPLPISWPPARRASPPLARQLTERAALLESLREPGEMAPHGGLQARRQLSWASGERARFCAVWPFRANSRMPGRQPEETGFWRRGFGSADRTRTYSLLVNGRSV